MVAQWSAFEEGFTFRAICVVGRAECAGTNVRGLSPAQMRWGKDFFFCGVSIFTACNNFRTTQMAGLRHLVCRKWLWGLGLVVDESEIGDILVASDQRDDVELVSFLQSEG